MITDGTAFLYYLLEGNNGNPDPSPERKLTIDHTLSPSLREPEFPDANSNGYINCVSSTPVWEKIRVEILPESVFADLDEFELEWQGFGTLNGAPPALTPVYKFKKTITGSEPTNGFIMDIPFDPYVKPLVNDDSGIDQYTIYRNSIPVYKSHKGLVKVDRMIPGDPIPCGGFP